MLMPMDYMKVILRGGPPKEPRAGCGEEAAGVHHGDAASHTAGTACPGAGGGGGSCLDWGCQLQLVDMPELPLMGAFPAGMVN
eukprot:gene7863-6221_t